MSRDIRTGVINFPIKKRFRPIYGEGAVADAKFDTAGWLALQMQGSRRRNKRVRADVKANLSVSRAVSVSRADRQRMNVLKGVAEWEGPCVISLDNKNYFSLNASGDATDYRENLDNNFAELPILPEDFSLTSRQMFSAPIGLRVMQTHWGAKAGAGVGPNSQVYAQAVPGTAVSEGCFIPRSGGQRGMLPYEDPTDDRGQYGSFTSGTKWFHQLGFQWNPIGVNVLDHNEYEKCKAYKYFRYKKFGMKITIDAPLFYASRKYANILRSVSSGTNQTGAPESFPDYDKISSIDYQKQVSFGAYEYMILGAETLRTLKLPDLMGFSAKPDANTDGLGAVHVWDALKEAGHRVHKCKSNKIDLVWKPYSTELHRDQFSSSWLKINYQEVEAGPIGPTVETKNVLRGSFTSITPGNLGAASAAAYTDLEQLPLRNNYPFIHYGPVVLLRFCMDPGADVMRNKLLSGVDYIGSFVAPASVSVGVKVKCWATYEAFGQEHTTFDISEVGTPWSVPVLPQVDPIDIELENGSNIDMDPINAG